MTQLDRSRLGHLTFSAPGHGGDWSRWAHRWPWGGQGKGAWTIGDDGSLCAYAPSQVTTQKGVLCLTARPSEAKDGDAAWDMPYVSGLISSFPFFKQTYGYFEVRAQFPRGRGLHPGIALYRNPNPAIEDEIDVIETIGDDTRGAFLTLHFGSGAKDYVSQTARVFDAGAGMCTHGLLWTDKTISWFQNDQLVASTPTHAAQHAPMSLIINLGVGGNWAGAPDPRAFPARLLVEGVKAYALKV